MQLSTWIFGQVMCKIVKSVYYLGFYSSVLFLALLTFDRHLAVVYSLGSTQLRNQRYAIISSAVVWLVSILACIKQMILHSAFTSFKGSTYCDEHDDGGIAIWAKLRTFGFYLQIFLFLLFPLFVIIYCYVRIAITVMSSKLVTKFKTVRLIFFIVLLFFVCWTPFNIVFLMHDKATECADIKNLGYALHVTRNLACIYFCISPILYTFVGRKFQNYFRQMVVKRFPELKKHIHVSQQSGNQMATRSTENE